jgi:hypothetical protein
MAREKKEPKRSRRLGTHEERQREAEQRERDLEESGIELSERGGIEPLVEPAEDHDRTKDRRLNEEPD